MHRVLHGALPPRALFPAPAALHIALALWTALAPAAAAAPSEEGEGGAQADPADPADPAEAGEEVVVTGTRVPRTITEAPVLTEVISAERIESKGAMCLIDALTYQPGVRIDNQCSVCNTTSVKLSGVPGRYTLLLVDGVPVYSSLGQTYGWLMLGAADIERIELVKGANSILYGTDAMGGVVNVITKAPGPQPSARLMAEAGAFGHQALTANAAVRKGRAAITLSGTHTAHDSVDRDGDQVSEFTGYDRSNFATTVRWDDDARVTVLSRVGTTQEKRQGGGLGSLIEVLDDDTRRGFTETVLTRRVDASSVIDVHVGPDLDLETTLAATQHLQDSDYEGEVYVGEQYMLFVQEAAVAKLAPTYSLVSGLSWRGEFLQENLAISDYDYHLVGVFAQGDWMPGRNFELLHGVRYDYHNVFGSIITPRVSVRARPLDRLTLRATGGTGFRAPTTFYEYAHGVRPEGYALEMDADKPERSLNANGSADIDLGRQLRITLEGAFNRIDNAITVETTADGHLSVYNVDGHLDVISAEAQLQSAPWEWLQLTAGYGHYIYDDPAGALVSAPPTDTLDLSMDLDLPWGTDITASAQVLGPMDLVGVYGVAYNGGADMTLEKWLDPANADLGSAKRDRSPWQGTIDARVAQEITPALSLYVGGKNLTDFHQNDVETPLMYPEESPGVAGPADVVYIWGPNRGRFLYGGVRVAL